MQVKEVKITKVPKCEGNQLSDTFFKNCLFCEKLVQIHSKNFGSCRKIGGNKFYCPFCLRNNFHHKTSKNVLIYSFRSIIGYYYYKFYKEKPQYHNSPHRMWHSEIRDMIESHAEIGLTSPVLSYDPSTYLWFADFNKIGKHTRKAPFKEVKAVIRASFEVFEVNKRLQAYDHDQFWDKFFKALDLFYQKRQRPVDRRMLIPTLYQNHFKEQIDFHEKTRNFIAPKLLLK